MTDQHKVEIVPGEMYLGADWGVARTVVTIFPDESGVLCVSYIEHPVGVTPRPIYWRLQETFSLPIADFEKWVTDLYERVWRNACRLRATLHTAP